jgi:O-antigen ligase
MNLPSLRQSFQEKSENLLSYLLTALIFFVPISTSASSIFAILIVLLWIIEGNFTVKYNELRHSSLVIALLAYVSLYALGLLWTEDLHWGLRQAEKQWKLLLLLPCITIAQRKHYKQYLTVFLASMTFSAVLSLLIWLEIIHLKGILPQSPIPFNSHISYNPLLALALYFLYHTLLFKRPQGTLRALLFSAGLVMTGSMFITTGRSGQVAFFVLLFLLILQYFRKRIVLGLAASLIILPALLVTAYQTGPGFKMRIDESIENLQGYRTKQDTSTATRLTFAINSIHLIEKSPWFGVGTGDFPAEYQKINETLTPSFVTTDDPHNHYLLVLALFGFFGLLVFLSIFVVQLRKAYAEKTELQDFRLALPVFYLVIMFGGTYLLGQELSLCFAITSGILYRDNPALHQ